MLNKRHPNIPVPNSWKPELLPNKERRAFTDRAALRTWRDRVFPGVCLWALTERGRGRRDTDREEKTYSHTHTHTHTHTQGKTMQRWRQIDERLEFCCFKPLCSCLLLQLEENNIQVFSLISSSYKQHLFHRVVRRTKEVIHIMNAESRPALSKRNANIHAISYSVSLLNTAAPHPHLSISSTEQLYYLVFALLSIFILHLRVRL